MTMTIRNMTYALGGLALAAFMNVSLNSCKSDNKKPTPEEKAKIEMKNDSLDTQILLHENGIIDPSLSYAQARMKLDSVMREKYPQARSLEEALKMDDSIRFVNMCKSLGEDVPEKPGPNATHEEKLEYSLKEMNIYLKKLHELCREPQFMDTLLEFLKDNSDRRSYVDSVS